MKAFLPLKNLFVFILLCIVGALYPQSRNWSLTTAEHGEVQLNRLNAETPSVLLNNAAQDVSLSGFTYHALNGPSALQSFTISSLYRTDDVLLTVTGDWEISTNKTFSGKNVYPYKEIKIPKNATNNTLAVQNIYVRLRKGLTTGNYAGSIAVTSTGAATRTVNLTGTVTAAVPVIQVKGGNSVIKYGQTEPMGLNNTVFAAREVGTSQEKLYTITNLGGAPLVVESISISGADQSQFEVINLPASPTTIPQDNAMTFSIRFKPLSVGVKTATVSIVNNDADPFTFAIRGTGLYCGTVSTLTVALQNFETDNVGWAFSAQNEEQYTATRASGKSGSNDAPAGRVLYSEGKQGFRIQGILSAGTSPLPYKMTFDVVDTSAMPEPELRLNVAAFSFGDKFNGMDDYGIGSDTTVTNENKVDYVLVEISPDGGGTWHPQAKIVSNEANLTWGFNTKYALMGVREYNSSTPLTYFVSSATEHYSEIAITGLPEASSLKVRISAQNNNSAEAWLLDDIKIVSQTLPTSVWDGNAWTPQLPQASYRAVIRGAYNTAASGAFNVCQCEVNGQLTVAKGTHITIADKLINNGEIVVENDAGLVQLNDEKSYSGAGTFTVKREAHMRRLDYTYWTSPVAGQQLKSFSPATLDNRFTIYNEGNDLFEIISPTRSFGENQLGPESPAKGYAIRAPNNFPSAPVPANAPIQTFNGVFKGVPNNGLIEFPLKYQSSPEGRGFNLIGNPYPGNINFTKFATDNSELIEGKAYFWTNINPTPAMQGSNYPNGGYISNYAILCLSGGVPVTLGSDSTVHSAMPSQVIKTGQGFIIKAKKAGTLQFGNAMRTDRNDGNFFSKDGKDERDRFWLQLKTPLGVVTTALIAYVEGATDDYDDDYDAELFGLGADALFSQLGERKLAIQGRAYPLRTDDAVPLGTNHFDHGTYTLRIGAKEGIFAKDQRVFVRDNATGTVADLTEAPYTFITPKGLVQGRLEILYQKPVVLSTGVNTTSQGVLVYRDGETFIVKSTMSIRRVDVYDSAGRLLMMTANHQKELRLETQEWVSGVYVLKIETDGGTVMKKVIK